MEKPEMIIDRDLEFLQKADTADLQILVDYLTKDSDGDARLTEELTSSSSYKRYYPDQLPLMADEIQEELRKFGGNTFANFMRSGHGVPYKELLTDVCKKMDVSFNPKADVEVIENCLLQKFAEKILAKMSDEDMKELLEELNIKVDCPTKQAMTAAIQIVLARGGFASYKLILIIVNALAKFLLGRGLSLAVNAAIARWLAVFTGPIGFILTTAWTAIDLAGPAYRVTIPATVHIAYMRLKQKYKPTK